MASVDTRAQPAAVPAALEEQRFLIHGVAWKDYLVLREALDVAGLRMTYCEGVLELMTISSEHERIKSITGRLISLYALERDVPLNAYGSTTLTHEARERGLEPDECYV